MLTKDRTEKNYNGWKNRQTWNIMLWINNDEPMYCYASEYMRKYKGKCPYKSFIAYMALDGDKTPDGIAWLGSRLDYKSLNEAMWELKGDS